MCRSVLCNGANSTFCAKLSKRHVSFALTLTLSPEGEGMRGNEHLVHAGVDVELWLLVPWFCSRFVQQKEKGGQYDGVDPLLGNR
jgi:hypothetical protein